MSTTDDQLADLLGKNSTLFAAYETWSNAQIMLLAGTIDDPDSFNSAGGKTGALGYYPVANVNGETIYVPCIARLQALAAGAADPDALDTLLATQVAAATDARSGAETARDAAEEAAAKLQPNPVESGAVFAIGDANDRTAFWIEPDGTVSMDKVALPGASVALATLVQDVINRLLAAPVGNLMQQLSPEQGGGMAIVDASGRVTAKIDGSGLLSLYKVALPQSTVNAVAAASGDVLGARLLADPVGGNLRQLTPEQGGGFAIVDANDRMSARIDASGNLTLYKATLAQPVINTVAVATGAALGFSPVAVESGLAFAITDQFGRIAFGINQDGTLYGSAKVTPKAEPPQATAAWLVTPFIDGSGNQQISTSRRSDGQPFQITNAGNNINVALSSDGFVLYSRNGTNYFQPAAGGAEYPVSPNGRIVQGYGDSLTQGSGGTPWTTQIASMMTTKTFVNHGLGGQGTTQIVSRLGADPSLLTVSGNVIPGAVSAVAVTHLSIPLLTWSSTLERTITGTLAGVPGTLDKDTSNNYTFTRTTAGADVACPADTPFIPDDGIAASQEILVLWGGRNDVPNFSTVTQPEMAKAVAFLKNFTKYFLLLGTTNLRDGTEDPGSANYNAIVAHNAYMAATYGGLTFGPGGAVSGSGSFLDVRRYLIDYGLGIAGITPTSQDLADIALDRIPQSLMANDNKHLVTAGYGVVARMIANTLLLKGW